MNFGDVATCGFFGPYYFTDSVTINSKRVPKKVILKQLALGFRLDRASSSVRH
jgi:hypothetical protein